MFVQGHVAAFEEDVWRSESVKCCSEDFEIVQIVW